MFFRDIWNQQLLKTKGSTTKMINIKITPADFEYDVMSLIQAFYPGEAFKMNKEEDSSDSDRAVSFSENNVHKQKIINSKDRELNVMFEHNNISVRYFDGDKDYSDDVTIVEDERRAVKNLLKKTLYNILSIATGKSLPWGNLTGIRPAKIPALMLENGISENEIRQVMKDTYLISDDKLELGLTIAKREFNILKDINYTQGYSIYIGIPFCPTTCLYCSFTSYPLGKYRELTDKYIDALVYEIEKVSVIMHGREVNTVYIGGGTPTTLSAEQLGRLIKAIRNNFDLSTIVEFTVEAGRPDSITEDKLIVLLDNGVDRISINPQTMNEETLKLIGRQHTVQDVIDKFYLARKVGFTNINMDIIIGLPEENEAKVIHTLEEISKLNPDSLTVHSLAVKRAARLNIQKEKYANMKMVNTEELMAIADRYSKSMDMLPYYLYRQKNMAGNLENVGYSRRGCEGIYNILMMGDKQDVIAMGAGATTKLMSEDRLSAVRVDNIKNIEQYIDRIDEMIERKREALAKRDI